jgi:phage gp29-like protein
VNASDSEKTKLLKALMAIQSDSAIRIPEGMTVELLEAARSGSADYCSLIDRMNAAISKVMLGHSAAADSTAGKLGGEDSAGDVRDDLIKADADLICNSFNQSVVKWLTQYNDPTAPLPRVWRKVAAEDDLKTVAETDKLIFDMGYKPTLTYINNKYGGEYEADEVRTGSPLRTASPEPSEFAENTPQTSPADEMVDLLGKTAQPAIDSYLYAIKGLLDSCDSLQEFQDRLPLLFPDMDTEMLAKILADAFLSADLAGRNDVNVGQ